MSDLLSLQAAFMEVRRDVLEILAILDSFQKKNQENLQLVYSALKGSKQGHDRTMSESIRQAEAALKDCSSQLSVAEVALLRVSTL